MAAKYVPNEPMKLMTLDEAAALAKLSVKTIRREIEKQSLAATRIGTSIRVSVAQYNDWVRRNGGEARF